MQIASASFFSPTSHPRRFFARYVNGTFSAGRRNKRALPSRGRFIRDDFCRPCACERERVPAIVIGIDILSLLSESTVLDLHPAFLSSASFPICSFSTALVPLGIGYIGFSGSTATHCIYRARARNLRAKRLDFGFTLHRVA